MAVLSRLTEYEESAQRYSFLREDRVLRLKQRSASTQRIEVDQSGDERRVERSGSRRAGILLVVLGLLFVGLAAGDALAGTGLGGFRESGETIRGGSGEDALIGGAGDDEIYGLGSRDLLFGGAGDDFIESSDGVRDEIKCGPGKDVASVDEKDLVSRDCETVYRN